MTSVLTQYYIVIRRNPSTISASLRRDPEDFMALSGWGLARQR